MTRSPSTRLALALALALTGGGLALSCGERLPDPGRGDRADTGVSFVFVTITSGDRGAPDRPLAFSSTPVTYTVRIEARRPDNTLATDFDGYVNLSVSPGVIERLEAPEIAMGMPRVSGRNVRLTGGVADGVRVSFVRAYGESRIYAEEGGYSPVDPGGAAPGCANGRDDDGDGRVDFPADYGCLAPNDDSERGGSFAIGASEAIYFGSPRISDVQGTGNVSPLLNERITVTAGTMIVTRISISGFWVTDTADRSCTDPMNPMGRPCRNSLFMFNFRLPEGLRPCDRLSRLQGTVQEFVSTTQLSQPAWSIDPNGGTWIDPMRSGACPIPDPVPVTGGMLANDTQLEPIENSIVRATDVIASRNIGPTRVMCRMLGGSAECEPFAPGRSNCDQNDDGTIDFDNPLENACASTCQRERGCSEWSNWRRFGQLAVDFATGQPAGVQRLVIAPREAFSNFDPLNQPWAPDTRITVTGTIKQVGPTWIIEPRCTADVALTAMDVQHPRDTCLLPRTVTEEP